MVNEKQRKTFLSYSRANKDFAIKLANELKAEGFYVWLDQLDIPAGARWDREVEKALKECEIFMIIMTPASIDSENVLDEIGYAIDNGKRFLPVLLENCDVPLRLRRFQYVDFTNKNFDEGVESAKELLRSLIAQTTIPRGGIPADSPDKDAQVKEETGRSAKQKAESARLAQTQAEHKDETASFAAERDKVLKASTLMTQGKQLLQEGDLPEAIQIFQQILTLMPNHEKTLTLLAEAEAGLLQERESSDRKAKEEADRLAVQKAEANRLTKQKADEELAAKANAESERKAKEEADRLAAQKAEDERLAKTKAEADRKAKEEADRLAAQKAEEERIAKAKAETERKAKEEADRLTAQIAEADFKAKEKAKFVEAMPVEIMTEPTPAATVQKKPMSKGLIIGIVAVVVLIVGGIGIGALSNRGTPATAAPYVAEPATEAPVVDNPATEAPTSDVSPQGEWGIFSSDQTQYLVFDSGGTFSVEARIISTNEVLYSGGGLWGADNNYIYYYDMNNNLTSTEGYYLANGGDTLVITSQDGSNTSEWTRISGTPFTDAPVATEAPADSNLIFSDDFTDPNNSYSNWGDVSPGYFENEKFYIVVPDNTGFFRYSPATIDFSQYGSDLVVVARATSVSNGRVGIYSRSPGNAQSNGPFYLFQIDFDLSQATIWINDGSNWENLATQSVTQSSSYDLVVVCVGNSLDFYVNGENVHVNDDRLTAAGQVGLYTESAGIAIEVDDFYVGYAQ